jgi:hypothetical protein
LRPSHYGRSIARMCFGVKTLGIICLQREKHSR